MLIVHVPVHVHAAHYRCVCVYECVFVFLCINAGMLDCPASDQSSTVMKKANDAGTGLVPDQAKAVRHFSVQYRTEILMTECQCRLVSWMPMPSYENNEEMFAKVNAT
jgi:hypothetical protein